MTFDDWAAKNKLKPNTKEYRLCQAAWEAAEADFATELLKRHAEVNEKVPVKKQWVS